MQPSRLRRPNHAIFAFALRSIRRTCHSMLKRALETIAMAKVSTSASEARSLGLLAPADRITMNRDRLLLDAKAQAAALAEPGYTPPQPRNACKSPRPASPRSPPLKRESI